MSDLLITTCNTQVEEALQTTILLALGKRLTVATNTALKALASNARAEDELAYNTAAGYVYRFNRYATTADNATTVLTPTDAPTVGRWLRTASTSSSGYVNEVALYEGVPEESRILETLTGRVPSVLIVWVGDDYEPRSQIPGALYRARMSYQIWCCSRNLRPERQGRTGSQISAESTLDPGVNKILGDLRSALAGDDLDQDGVDWVEIQSAERILASKIRERCYIYRLDIEVRATIHNPESDLVTLDDPRSIDVQYQLGDLHGEDEHDPDNYRVSGITVPVASGLTQSIASGTAYIDGTLVTYAGQSKAFTASKATYRDLSSAGTLTFVEAALDSEEPDVTSGALRIGVTLTSASAVTDDRILAPSLENLGSPDRIPNE